MPGSIHRGFARHAFKDARHGKRASKHASGASPDQGSPVGAELGDDLSKQLAGKPQAGKSPQKQETGAGGPGHWSRSTPFPISLGAPLFYFNGAGYNTNSLVASSRDQHSSSVADWSSRPQQ